MELKRRTFQGISNIILFNRHFYILAAVILISLSILTQFFSHSWQLASLVVIILIGSTLFLSILISFYVYDLSDLYQLKWLPEKINGDILNITAGFDESSDIIKSGKQYNKLITCDFFDPRKHTEKSILRARKAYPLQQNSIRVSTNKLPFPDNSFECCHAFLSAHEIRDNKERNIFFKELNRITKSNGQIFITEHLRDFPNFIAYTLGFFHFHSKSTWLRNFKESHLKVIREIKTTPFITTFILEKDGDTF